MVVRMGGARGGPTEPSADFDVREIERQITGGCLAHPHLWPKAYEALGGEQFGSRACAAI